MISRVLRTGAVALGLLVPCGAAAQDQADASHTRAIPLNVTENRETIWVAGEDFTAARDAVRALERERGGASFARTRLTYSAALQPAGNQCEVASAEISLEIALSLVDWREKTAASPADREAWQLLRAGLEHHEEGHGDIARAGAARLQERFGRILTDGDCVRLRRQLDREFETIQQEIAREQRDYEHHTDHGRIAR